MSLKFLELRKCKYGSYDEAIGFFGKAIDTDKRFAPPYYLIGVSYYNKYRSEAFAWFSEIDDTTLDKYLKYMWNI